MFSSTLTTILVCLVAFTSAWPTASTVLTRDASADPADAAITGSQVAAVFVYSTTSTSNNFINGAKQCKTAAIVAKLENGVCWSTPNSGLGIKLSSAFSGCKGMSQISSE